MEIKHLSENRGRYSITSPSGYSLSFETANPYKHCSAQRAKLAKGQHPDERLQHEWDKLGGFVAAMITDEPADALIAARAAKWGFGRNTAAYQASVQAKKDARRAQREGNDAAYREAHARFLELNRGKRAKYG